MKIIHAAAILTTPQVPRLDNVPSTQPLATPRSHGLGPDAFGAGLGQGLQQSGRVGMSIAGEEFAKADRIATIETRTKLDQAEVDLLYHPENGALAKRGKDAFSLEEPTLQAFDKRAGEIESGLTTDSQKVAFRALSGQRRVEVDKQIQRHVAGEIKGYIDETNKASLESTLNNVSQHYNDPIRIEQELKFGQAVIMSDTDNKGKPPEFIKLRMAAWQSKVHESVIDKLMVDNAIAAQEYFVTNKDTILPAEAAKLERALKPLATKQLGMDTALKLAPMLEVMPLTDVLATTRNELKGNPDALNLAETQLKQMETERRDRIKQVKTETATPIYQQIAKIQLSGRAAKLSDIPRDQWTALMKVDPEEAGKIQDALRREVQGEEDRNLKRSELKIRKDELNLNKTTTDNLTTWGALKLNPEALKRTNLDALFVQGKMNKSQYQDLITDQLAIKQGNGEHETKILSNKAAVDSVLSTVKIDGKKTPEKYMKFYDALNVRLRTFEAETGAKPKQEDVVRLSRGLLAEVSQDRSFWFDKTVNAFDADPSRVVVPKTDKDAITKALKANNRPVTDDSIRQLYLEKQIRKGGK